MGWVSYFEDNRDRLEASIIAARQAIDGNTSNTGDRRKEALVALEDAKALLEEISSLLDLATSPEIELAFVIEQQKTQIFELGRERDRLSWRLEESEDQYLQALMELDTSQGYDDHVKKKLEEQRRRIKDLEEVEAAYVGADAMASDAPTRIARLTAELESADKEIKSLRKQLSNIQSPGYWMEQIRLYLSTAEIRKSGKRKL